MQEKEYQIGLIHATMNSVQPILEAFREHAPDVTIVNFMDESLIFELNETNTVTKDMVRRLLNLAQKAVDYGVDGILLTCSSFTPAVAQISHLFEVPMLSADLSMLERAVEIGSRIGVIATVAAAGPTTTGLLEGIAAKHGKEVSIKTVIIPEAFEALQKRNQTKHDQLIHQKAEELALECDVILFAQFSMARALKTLKAKPKPILTSPEISVKAIIDEVSKKEAVLND
ncbi:aspartate/glutamate racemase family protein [Domibacillus sp. PGB-M46]|uniref:aspartate/glutamate racemase family protein n=1 Tax=Domibacillus sp. PGB-M46 TaxID=2910255 RepID=UPI001F576ABD|nr:aspartate/glutamate racemase family protein [Domibacillus sp. PGB-M46]MCI2256125.1 aspartate/glutamate racemase family protein [Domibacillus sp. PGB-M46]